MGIRLDDPKVFVWDNLYVSTLNDKLGFKSTTGLRSIYFFLNVINTHKKLNIIGFDFFESGNYFQDNNSKKKKRAFQNHSPDKEKNYVENLANNKLINIY